MRTNGLMFPVLMGLEQEGSACLYTAHACFLHWGCMDKCVIKCHAMMETS